GEVLLQRTRGESVAIVYEDFLKRWPTFVELARAKKQSVERVTASLGLPKRVPQLLALARALNEHGGVPMDPKELMKLPGIGPYAAHAVPIFAADRDLPLVDWVIARLLRRFFGLVSDRRPSVDNDLW